MRSASDCGAAALEQAAAQSQMIRHRRNGDLKIVLFFFLVAFAAENHDGDQHYGQNPGNQLHSSLGHVRSCV